MYVAISPAISDPCDDPSDALLKVGPAESDIVVLSVESPLLKTSVRVNEERPVFPVFSTVIVKTTVSPAPGRLSPLVSTKTPVFVVSMDAVAAKFVTVESFVVLPSKSLPSSL